MVARGRLAPGFENLRDLPNALRIQACEQGPLKVVHRRSGIVLQEQGRNSKGDVGKTRFIADAIKRNRVGVVDDVGCVTCLARGSFEQWGGSGKIPVFQRLEGILITHATAVSARLLPFSRLKTFLRPTFQTSLFLRPIDAAFL